MDVLEKGESGEFVEIVEAGLVEPFCCVEGHEGARIGDTGYGGDGGEQNSWGGVFEGLKFV